MCFFAGGTRFSEQGFGTSKPNLSLIRSDIILYLEPLGAVQLNSSLLIVSVIAILLPTAFHFTAGDQIDDPKEGRDILAVSHGVRFIPTNRAHRNNTDTTCISFCSRPLLFSCLVSIHRIFCIQWY